jgi:hypothetical protein
MTPVDTLGEPVTVVDTLGEPVVLINEDGTPAFLAYSAKTYLGGVAPYHWLDFINNRALYAGADVGNVTQATGYSFTRASQGYYTNSDGTLTLFGYNLLTWSEDFSNAAWTKSNTTAGVDTITASSTGASREVNRGFTSTSGTPYTFSLELKQGNTAQSDFAIIDQGVAVYRGRLTYATGAVTAVSGSPALTVLALSGGWFRVSISVTIPTGGSDSIHITPNTDASSTAGDFCYVRNAQLEPSASLGSYVPTTSAAAGALRRGDRGVLIEGSRTNLLLRSQEFGTTWTAQRTTVTANTIAAPDGTTTADTVLETVDNGSHGVFQAITKAASSITYALSCHIKPNGRDWAILQLDSAGETNRVRVWFDLTGSGSVGSNVAGGTGFSFVSASIQALANGWYRCVAVITGDTNTTHTSHVRPATADTTVSYAGDITKGLYLWGAQLEAASFASSYVKSEAAASTRAADVLTYTAGVSYPIQLWSEFERVVDTGTNEGLISVSASGTNLSDLNIDGTDQIELRLNVGGSAAFPAVSGAVTVGAVTKAAARVSNLDHRAVRNGTLGTANTALGVPSAPATIRVGLLTAGGNFLFGYIRRIAVIQGAGTDANLEVMTT